MTERCPLILGHQSGSQIVGLRQNPAFRSRPSWWMMTDNFLKAASDDLSETHFIFSRQSLGFTVKNVWNLNLCITMMAIYPHCCHRQEEWIIRY